MTNWIRSIACYTIAVSLLLGILPEGDYKKYVKFFMGMVLSLVLVSPIMKLFSVDTSLALYYQGQLEQLEDVWGKQKELLEEQEKEALEALIQNTIEPLGYCLRCMQYETHQKQLTVWIGANILSPPIVVEEVSVWVSETKAKSEEEKSLQQLLSTVCGISEEDVCIVWEGD